MLSNEEKEFIIYWEKNRLKQRKLFYQLLWGLPLGILFGAPLIVNFLMGRFWYTRADAVGMSQFSPTVLVIAVLLIVVFIAIFNKKHKWDLYEQRYLELKSKQKTESSPESPT